MQNVFLELVKLSLIGSLFAAAVMLVRLVFRKAPKWLFCVLWGVVALRLICPVSIESNVSLVPDRLATGQIITNVGNEYIGDVDIIYESNAGYNNAIEAGRQPIYSNDGYYVVTEKDSMEAPKTVGQTVYPVLSWIWVAGMILMLAYTAVSYLLLRKKMEEATQLRDNIWQCEQVDSPFVLGFIKPRIYLPYAITDSDMANVIAHEQAHIQRKDHWWKPIGFLLLSIHWFNPVLWLAYILLCRDIEAACDEKVIKHMKIDEVRAYSTALLHCSVHRRRIAACPLAFGEVGVKERIKRVMNYKKPAFWIIITAIVACSIAVVCFFTNPSNSSGALPNIHSHAYVVEEVTYESGTYSFSVVAGENSPIYAITEDMTLVSQKEVSEEGIWAQLGKLEEIKLTKDNFDELFFSKGLWNESTNAKSIRKNTVNAWQLIYNQDVLYYVLQQKNGDLYLAYGYYDYSEKNDPYSDDTNIRWLFKLAIDTSGMSGMVAKSGDSAVPMLSFPKGTMIKDYVGSIYWLTIDPSDEEFAPFTVWKDGEEIRGTYTAYDAVTFEPLKHFMPSGLDPQTYLFQNADPTKSYIVLATFSTESDAEIYAFGARFDSTISFVGGADGPTATYSEVKLTDQISDAQESSYKVSVFLPATDLSSPGQILADKIANEWKTYDGMTQQQHLTSSHLWGVVYVNTETWNECEQAIGVTIDNPLETIDWINNTGYFGMESADPSTPVTHVKATAYATHSTDRKLGEIHVTAGYNKGNVQITISATVSATSGTITTGGITRGYATFEHDTATTGSGVPVLIVTTNEANNLGYYNGDYYDPTAYWVKDNVFYTLRVFGDEVNQTEIQETLDLILAEI